MWDRVELLAGGVLRVASITSWQDSQSGQYYSAEADAEYHPPGAWTLFTPVIEKNGTLVLTVKGYAPEILGDCMTARQAQDAAEGYLRDNYVDGDLLAEQVTEFFTVSAGERGSGACGG